MRIWCLCPINSMGVWKFLSGIYLQLYGGLYWSIMYTWWEFWWTMWGENPSCSLIFSIFSNKSVVCCSKYVDNDVERAGITDNSDLPESDESVSKSNSESNQFEFWFSTIDVYNVYIPTKAYRIAILEYLVSEQTKEITFKSQLTHRILEISPNHR